MLASSAVDTLASRLRHHMGSPSQALVRYRPSLVEVSQQVGKDLEALGKVTEQAVLVVGVVGGHLAETCMQGSQEVQHGVMQRFYRLVPCLWDRHIMATMRYCTKKYCITMSRSWVKGP